MLILNEVEYAEHCLETGFVEKKPYSTLYILAKYYYHHLGLTPDDVYKKLIEFADDYCDDYYGHEEHWNTNLKKMMKNIPEANLIQIDGVWITKSELDKIKELNNEQLEQLAFTMLCLAKFNYLKNPASDAWINTDLKELFSLANVTCKVDARYGKINKLYASGLIEFSKKIDDLSMHIVFAEPNESDGELFISDFRELGYAYLKYRGYDYIECAKCGILVKNNQSRNKKYCSSCAKYIKKPNRIFECVDCGIKVRVPQTNQRSIRCDLCKESYNKQRKHLEYINRKEISHNDLEQINL